MRRVVVTGGSSGIGAAVARRFVTEGEQVVIAARDGERVRRVADQIGARGEVCDVTDPRSVASLAERVGGGIDVLVAMAGGNVEPPTRPEMLPLERLSDEWEANLRTNTIGTVLTVSAFLPAMRDGGAVVTVSSIGAEYASGPYGASKAAVAAWTTGLAAEVGRRGITANAIAPGYVEDTSFFGDSMTPQRRARLIEATHTGRAGRPRDISGLVWFLASEDARHITGQTLHVNGGAHTTR